MTFLSKIGIFVANHNESNGLNAGQTCSRNVVIDYFRSGFDGS